MTMMTVNQSLPAVARKLLAMRRLPSLVDRSSRLDGFGLCRLLKVHGDDHAYAGVSAVFGSRAYGSGPECFGAAGDFNEHRLMALCFLAALTDDDMTIFHGSRA